MLLWSFLSIGVASLDELIHYDISKSKHFSDIPKKKKMDIIKVIKELKRFKALEVWLETQGLPVKYTKRLETENNKYLEERS